MEDGQGKLRSRQSSQEGTEDGAAVSPLHRPFSGACSISLEGTPITSILRRA